MRHLPFLKALAEVSGTEDPVWRDASAGYLVLRFFDRWLEEGPARISADTGLEGLRTRIRSLPDVAPQVRDTLLKAIQEMVDAEEANPAVVSESLLNYGKYLQSVGRLQLAAHVYQTMIEVLDSPDGCADPLAAATAHMQYGFVARFLGEFDASDEAYRRAGTLADKAGSKEMSLRARMGAANILKARGNLGDAEMLLDQVIAEAVETGIVNAESRALHSRGVIREARGRYVDATIDLFHAHELADDASQREFILGDMAACAAAAGYRQMAGNTNRILAYTAREPLVRSAALGNLLEDATHDGTAADCERLREQIREHARKYPLPAEHAIHIALHTAHSIERFGTRDAAIAAYESVIEEAHEGGFYQVAFRAEKRLAEYKAGIASHDSPLIQDPPETLRSVVDTIAEWSVLAAAST